MYSDSLVQELVPGTVTFRESGEQMLLVDYLQALQKEFKELEERERALRKELSLVTSAYLKELDPVEERQNVQRRLKWALEEQGMLQLVYPTLAGLPMDLASNSVEAYQLTDYILSAVCALTGLKVQLPLPVQAPLGQTIKLVTTAPDRYHQAQNKIKVWSHLLSLHNPVPGVAPRRRFGVERERQSALNTRLQRIEDKLDEILSRTDPTKSNAGPRQKRKS